MGFSIGDFNIEIIDDGIFFKKFLSQYEKDFNFADLEIQIANSDLEFEKRNAKQYYADSYLHFIASFRKFAEWLPNNNAFVLHSATFDVDGVGVAFAARSGTGKSTHMFLWQKLLGDRMTVVNGDKPIVRFFEDEPECPYAYGTPWNGKEKLGCNMRTPLKHICFIERAKENSVEKVDSKDAINRILNQVYMPKNPVALAKTMELINRLINCCNFWQINCNMEPEAAEVAYNTIFGENQ